MTKHTKKNIYQAIINFVESGNFTYGENTVTLEQLKAFAQHEIELLEKKAPPKNKANDELAEVIIEILTDEPQTIREIVDQIEGEDVTPAKVAYRLNALAKQGRIKRIGATAAKLVSFKRV